MLCSLGCCGKICLPLSLACIGLLTAFYQVIITGNHDALEIYTTDDASTAKSSIVEAILMYCVTLFLSILCLLPECRKRILLMPESEDLSNPALPLLEKNSFQKKSQGDEEAISEPTNPIGFDPTDQYVLQTP